MKFQRLKYPYFPLEYIASTSTKVITLPPSEAAALPQALNPFGE